MKEQWKRLFGLGIVGAMLLAFVTLAFALDPKGKPKAMGPNSPSGFYLWQDDKGWHVRTTTGNQKHHFVGEIVSEGGTVSGLKQYRDEQANWLKLQGNKINFDLTTEQNIDGFDFQSGGNLTFNLTLDDSNAAENVFVGTTGEHPSGVPFTVSAR